MHTMEELTEMNIWQRFQLADWRIEIFTIVFCVVFVSLFKFGDLYNTGKVSTFLNGVRVVFEENFALFGVGNEKLYEKDSSENFASYASGRVNIAKVNLIFRLAPRQNVFIWVMEVLFGYFTDSVKVPEDRVDIVITPSVDYENFISAIVSKLGMSDSRKFSYFLSLTKTSDSAALPESFVFMSEANEFQEKTFTPELALALNLSMASYLKYIAFTDQPNEKPEAIRDMIPKRRIVLSMVLPTGSKQLADVSKLLAAVFDVVDKIAAKEITFKPEAFKKIVKAREAEIAKIKKAEELAKQEELAEEKAKIKRQEKDQMRNLSRDEQLKAEKKAQEKKARKAQRKMKVRQ